MILYLMRHANAGTFRENPALDAKRGLIKEGKEQCMLMARVLGAVKAPIDVIVSSPLKRAMQTAQLVGTELGYDAQGGSQPGAGIRCQLCGVSADAGEVFRPRGNSGGRA